VTETKARRLMPRTMEDADIARLRLRQQHLLGAPAASMEAVISQLGAVQAQEFAVAKWSLARRSRGQVTEAQFDKAFAEGRILRTHILRPTWHFVLPADLRWLMAATAPRVLAMSASYSRILGVDEACARRTQRLMRQALAGGQYLTRQEIGDLFARDGLTARGQLLGYIMLRAELDLVVCSGPVRGKQQTYALVDERVPPGPTLTADQALAELTRRYFLSHGPATLRDFMWWASLTAAGARRGLELVGGELQRLEAGGRTYWLSKRPARRAPSEVATVHLLQAYDEYMVAYTESKPVLALAGLQPLPASWTLYMHAIVHDGQLVGHWRRAVGKNEIILEAKIRRRLGRDARRALQDEVDRFARFAQQPTRLVLK
jgi:hypothetical protein